MMLTMLVTRVVKYDVNYGYLGCRRRRGTLDDQIRLSWITVVATFITLISKQ